MNFGMGTEQSFQLLDIFILLYYIFMWSHVLSTDEYKITVSTNSEKTEDSLHPVVSNIQSRLILQAYPSG